MLILPRGMPRLSVASLASAAATGVLIARSASVLLGLLAVVAAVLLVVVGPAVWSKKKQRRDAALAVLDRLFRYRG
jgi:hypothetical protein